MGWIKIDHDLESKPEVITIARKLRMSRSMVIGHLVRFWCWADRHTENGDLPGITIGDLCALFATKPVFWSAVEEVGWIKVTETGLFIPGWAKYMSSSAKARERVRRHRERKSAQKNEKEHSSGGACNASVTPCNVTARNTGVSSSRSRNASVTRRNALEKRREEKRNNLTVISPAAPEAQTAAPPADAGEAQDDDLIWQAFGPPNPSTDADASSPEPDRSEQSPECFAEPEDGAPPPEQPPKRARKPRDPERAALWEAIRDVTGLDTSRPRSCKRIQKAIRELREADPPYTADEVRRLPEVLQELGWTASLTPEAIAKHIDLVRNPPVRVNGHDTQRQLSEMLDRWVAKKTREAAQ